MVTVTLINAMSNSRIFPFLCYSHGNLWYRWLVQATPFNCISTVQIHFHFTFTVLSTKFQLEDYQSRAQTLYRTWKKSLVKHVFNFGSQCMHWRDVL